MRKFRFSVVATRVPLRYTEITFAYRLIFLITYCLYIVVLFLCENSNADFAPGYPLCARSPFKFVQDIRHGKRFHRLFFSCVVTIDNTGSTGELNRSFWEEWLYCYSQSGYLFCLDVFTNSPLSSPCMRNFLET